MTIPYSFCEVKDGVVIDLWGLHVLEVDEVIGVVVAISGVSRHRPVFVRVIHGCVLSNVVGVMVERKKRKEEESLEPERSNVILPLQPHRKWAFPPQPIRFGPRIIQGLEEATLFL